MKAIFDVVKIERGECIGGESRIRAESGSGKCIAAKRSPTFETEEYVRPGYKN